MHIALVTDYYLPTLGGVQTVIKAHREELLAAGHEVTILTPLSAASEDPGVVALPIAGGFAPDGYPFAWPPRRVEDRIREVLAERGIDVVHVHTEMFAALGGHRAAAALGIPIVQTMHGRIDVYTRNVLPLPAVTTILLAGMHRARLPHRGVRIAGDAPYTRTRLARRMWRLMVAQAQHADQVIVPSQHFADKLVAQGVRRPVTVLSNGLEDSVLAEIGTPEIREARPDERLRVMWCGRVSPEKRPELFVEALRGVDADGDLYGDGVDRERIARATRDVEAITVHGPVPQREVLSAMRRAHVLVSSSFDFDNQPMVMLEAIASGLPVIYTDPDLAEVVPPGAGILTPTPDTAGLASVLRALAADPGRVRALSAAAIAGRANTAQTTHLRALLEVYRAARES